MSDSKAPIEMPKSDLLRERFFFFSVLFVVVFFFFCYDQQDIRIALNGSFFFFKKCRSTKQKSAVLKST